MKKIVIIVEPQWGKELLYYLNDYANSNYLFKQIIPYTADVFVFLYPIFLVIIYIIGVYNNRYQYLFRYGGLYIFFSVVFAFLFTILIQQFIFKQRPEEFIGMKDNLIIPHIPDISFPSDHAVVSSSFAFACIFWGIKNKSNFFIIFGFIFLIFSFIMIFSRVAAGIHWPTDVMAGFIIGFIFPLMLIFLYNIVFEKILSILIKLQEYVFGFLRLKTGK